MSARTAQKVSKTFLPVAFREAIAENGCNKNSVNVVVFADDSRKINAHDTRRDGGTWNEYYTVELRSESKFLNRQLPQENQELRIPVGYAVVILSYFCGQQCNPTVYVRNVDMPLLFGVDLGENNQIPAEVAADAIEEKAETAKPREAKQLRKAAEGLRKFFAVGAHGETL